jgi:F-type H+-transporting ATPase subunit b
VLEFPPDITFLVQAGLFLFVWFALNRVFRRFLDNGERRHERVAGALEEAKKLRDEAAALARDTEQQLAEIRRSAAAAKDEIRRHAEEEEQALLDGARREAAETLTRVRAEIATATAVARASLDGQIAELAELALARLTKVDR